MPRLRRNGFAFLLFASLLTALGGSAAAHVDIDVGDGQYVMEVGFRDEPALQGQPNAVFIAVEKYGTGGTEPVDGLAGTLQAEVSRDGVAKTIPFVPMGDGVYEAPFVPTATGDYTFRIFGDIEGNAVDESVTSGPQTFNSVDPLSAHEFPPAIAGNEAQAGLTAAQDAAAQARTFAIVSLVVGVVALIAALLMGMRSRRPVAETEITPPVDAPGRLIK
ncbi:MAG: hypothetical protein M3Z20_18845 [Chloroflexota bacterium]|nr:hypothetical protein [Chloroflexota bacterium]